MELSYKTHSSMGIPTILFALTLFYLAGQGGCFIYQSCLH